MRERDRPLLRDDCAEVYRDLGLSGVRSRSRRGPSGLPRRSRGLGRAPSGAASRRVESAGYECGIKPGEAAFYGPKVECDFARRARPRLDALDDPGRHGDARALRAPLRRPRRPGAPARDAAPRDPRLARALHRDLPRAHRGRLPALARAGAGRACCRSRIATTTTPARWRAALRAAGLRVELDARNEKLNFKIREAELQKIPVMLVVGDQEEANGNRHSAPRRGPQERGGAVASTRSWRELAARSPRREDLKPGPVRADRERGRASPRRTRPAINERIRVREIRVIGAEGEQLGVMTPEEARRDGRRKRASTSSRSRPTRNPPVCRIMDYGKYKYEQKKKARRARRRARGTRRR